jgi:putative CocE/NonD family hydrolase
MRIELDVKIPMRDGVNLSADIYYPGEGRVFPTLLIRTIYDKQEPRYVAWTPRFVASGYAVVMQDCRGRHDSDGEWEPYVHEASDGYDTQQWIGAQSWSDGNMGTFGISYVGFTQTLPSVFRSPHLKALVPIASQQDNFGHFYVDGALQLHVAMFFLNMTGRTMKRQALSLLNWDELWRRLPLVSALDDITDLAFYRKVIQHCTFDEFWKAFSLREKYEEVDTPAYFITGWYDNLVHEAFKLYSGWSSRARSKRTREKTKLLVGPWSHQNIGSAEDFGSIGFTASAAMDIVGEQLRWFDERLKKKNTGIDEEAPIHLFVMGENVWRHENAWPLERARLTPYYLHSRGAANSQFGDGTLSTELPGDESPDRYVYDPSDPVPSLGGPYMLLVNSGPWDRRPVQRRDDVLVYTSELLESDLEVTGPITVNLYASSTALDTDFTATLVDVHPCGKAIILCEGLVRARFRKSIEDPTLIEPGRIYKYEIHLWETSNMFKRGHRVRVEVSSSNFPRFDRNLNTGNRPGMDAQMGIAEQTVYHDRKYPSRINLPVVPR